MDKTNIHIFSGEAYMIGQNLKKLKEQIENPQLNVIEYKAMPTADELKEACAGYPFLAEKRLVVVRDCTVLGASGSAEEAKKIAEYIDYMPETTVLVLCSAEPPDKRRALYRKAAQTGMVRVFDTPTAAMCAAFASEQAKSLGARISQKTAQLLVSRVGCDYYALENEMSKLAVYSGFGEITPEHIEACVSLSLEYNVFEIHKLLADRKAQKAYALLSDILQQERPEALIGLFARKLRDMYKVRTMRDAGFGKERIEAQLKMKSYPVQMLLSECARFSAEELRHGLMELADLDHGIKSGGVDAPLALSEALCRIYGL